jgi:phospholipid/cholesterol/gamma-HCH transport system substrate-binding protein
VKDLRIEGGRVAMELGVEDSVVLPKDSNAEVVIETLLGRRSVALVAGESDELLEDGDVIPLDRTITPVDITELNDIQVELLNASDADAFETFLEDVAEITEGKATEVSALIKGLNRVLEAVNSRREQLGRLIESLRTLATTFGRRDDTIVSLIDNLDVVLGNLAQRQEELRILLESTAGASTETAALVRRNRAVLDSTLTSLHQDLQTLETHQLDLAAGIAYLENAVQGYSSVGYSQGKPNHWANIFVESLGPASVDALVGEGGLVDDLVDEFFCPNGDCPADFAGGPSATGGEPGNESQAGDEGATPGIGGTNVEPPEDDLPCSVGDVLDSALAGTGEAQVGAC